MRICVATCLCARRVALRETTEQEAPSPPSGRLLRTVPGAEVYRVKHTVSVATGLWHRPSLRLTHLTTEPRSR